MECRVWQKDWSVQQTCKPASLEGEGGKGLELSHTGDESGRPRTTGIARNCPPAREVSAEGGWAAPVRRCLYAGTEWLRTWVGGGGLTEEQQEEARITHAAKDSRWKRRHELTFSLK